MYVVCMFVCMFACMCVYVCIFACMYVCMYVHIYVCICMFVCMCMYFCVCVCTYVCMYLSFYLDVYPFFLNNLAIHQKNKAKSLRKTSRHNGDLHRQKVLTSGIYSFYGWQFSGRSLRPGGLP